MKNRFVNTLLTICLIAGCSSKPAQSSTEKKIDSYSNTSLQEVFDTVYSFKEYTDNKELAASHFKTSENQLQKYTQLFDIYNDYEGVNNLKTINDNAGIQPVKVDPVIISMLKTAKNFYDWSNGEFDITIGSLLKVWHTYREEGIALNEEGKEGKVPSKSELEAAAKNKGWEYVQIDEDDSTVYITNPDVSLDVGGIAKGYATELCAKTMKETGMTTGILNVGRNIRLLGEKEDGNWSVGITDPEGKYPNGLVVLSFKEEESVVTSGDYERYYKADDGQIYPHIVDPSTMYPARLYRSVSILTEDSGAADCLSTALFTMSIEEGKQLLKTYTEKTGKEAGAIWITEKDKTQNEEYKTVGDYNVICTDNLEDKILWN